uniref:Uncharacterized protein n=1 Tax=Arundo donax TaxID=35708 RepID=A0A0A8Y7X6_ARUDO
MLTEEFKNKWFITLTFSDSPRTQLQNMNQVFSTAEFRE